MKHSSGRHYYYLIATCFVLIAVSIGGTVIDYYISQKMQKSYALQMMELGEPKFPDDPILQYRDIEDITGTLVHAVSILAALFCIVMAFKIRRLNNEVNRYKEKAEEDLIALQEAQTGLADAQRRLLLAKKSARFAVWDWHVASSKISWDEEMFTLYEINPKDFNGTLEDWSNCILKEDREDALKEINALLNDTEAKAIDTIFRIHSEEKGIKYIKATGNIMRDTEGAPLRLIGINYDISDTKLLEEELRQHKDTLEMRVAQQTKDLVIAKDKAEAASLAKSEFLSNMTHELRTPLNSIIGMTNLLKETELKREQQELLDVVKNASLMLLETVNDILDLSKIEAGEIRLEQIGFDVTSVINRCYSTLSPAALGKGLFIECSFVPNTNVPFVIGDPLRLSQIFNNLIANAIKYTVQGSVSIEVLHQTEGNTTNLTFMVTDTGIGIPPEKMDSIFQKFVQADTSTSRKFGGTGLGLAICKQLAEMMGGQIGVDSKIGSGSTFWVTIPFNVTEQLQVDNRIKRKHTHILLQHRKAPKDLRVLIAEDHPLNQMFICKLLTKLGIDNYTLVENGREVLRALNKESFDLILMDCYMPDINGYEATQMIRNSEKFSGTHIPIIAITANAMMGDEQKCLEAGMDDYIPKPIQVDEFVDVLESWIEWPEAVARLAEKQPALFFSEAATSNAATPVDLSILRTFTDGDADMEKECIEVFLKQSDHNLEVLSEHCVSGECKPWVEASHMLKGGAGGLGAKQLQQLCAKAQSMQEAADNERRQILDNILAEYQQVKSFLSSHNQHTTH